MSVTTPIVNAGLLYINGLNMTWVSTTTLTVGAGAARNSTDVNDITLGATVTNTSTTVGVNGVDLAAAAASSLYAVYVIGDSNGYKATASLLSLSATAPSLPFGYNMFRRIGYVLTDGSSHYLAFWQYGTGQARKMYYDVGISVLSGGSSTSYASIDMSAAVPVEACEVLGLATYTANSATNVAHFIPYGSGATNGVVQFGYGVAAAQVGMITIPTQLNGSKPECQYKVASSDALTLLVAGYTDVL